MLWMFIKCKINLRDLLNFYSFFILRFFITQLALHVALTSLFSSEIKNLTIRKDRTSGNVIFTKCVYICGPMTPTHPLIRRVKELEQYFKKIVKNQKYPAEIQNLCTFENIEFIRCYSVNEVLESLKNIDFQNKRLIVVDRVADFFTGQDENVKVSKIGLDKLILSQKLLEIARCHDLAVVVLNNVSDVFDDTPIHKITQFEKDIGYRACLGARWADCLTGGRYYFLKNESTGTREIVDTKGNRIGIRIKESGISIAK